MNDGPLDMRFNPDLNKLSAKEFLDNVSEEKLYSAEGEAEVLEELRMVINEHLEKHERTTSAPIEEVYFTELIVQ